ncbi:MAG: hypothetical protein GF381_02495 [Candidatus Pacebacteria bacterium]|nr:hypothetical protein [Candidatus Paceibacterota bacterium]
MPILPNAKKALRVSKRKREVNQKIKSQVRTARKKMQTEPSKENLEKLYSAVDKAVKKNVFHSNKAARVKSQGASLLADQDSTKA